ncbi:MAG: response regulator [Chloroflexi bacterium]|nr:response regulator [Chloroflexota bacterium]
MSPERILVVEDEVRVSQALCRVLALPEGGGHTVEACESGETALERLQAQRFDLVITDLRMPGMSGLDLLEHVHRISPTTRTVLITAYGTPQIEARAKELADAYVPKPFNMQGFVRLVRQTLAMPLPESRRLIAFSETGLRAVQARIESLRSDLGAAGALMFDQAGQSLIETGRHGDLDTQALLAVIGTTMIASNQVISALQDEASFTLHFFEGKNYELYATRLSDQVFLTLLFERQGSAQGKVGMIWLALRRAVVEIRQNLNQATLAGVEPLPAPATPPPNVSPAPEASAPPAETPPVAAQPGSTLSYEQARALGLINLDDLEAN